MTYCFRNGDDVVTEVFPLGKAPEFIERNGRRYSRSWRDERVGVPPTTGWPIECVASGVHPSQAQELRDFLEKKGVPTEVTPDGNPVYRDAQHRKRALKARGLHDNASYL